ncbi:heavy-metal-associated domain-containing protein [Natronorarus salvus]|uniref:heavy-metal-associated domain-containing protein n=1 Tax=Natronorarus salvus TaxID=3117733 RepID=UPI002F260D71
MDTARAEFTVPGIESDEDAERLREGLREVEGVLSVEIDRESGETTVDYDAWRWPPAEGRDAGADQS